ncbi:hypothetical protein [Dongia sp.]|uniref:hypothetical protein n=1 Tax=Dongia sp. TaxID=1977262 RepID=UPI0037506C82
MKKLLVALLLSISVFPSLSLAQLTVPQGGTGTTTFPANSFVVGNSALRLTSTSSPYFPNGVTVSGNCIGCGVSQINTTFPITGGPITTTGTLGFAGISTSSATSISGVPYWTSANLLGTIATGTISASGGVTVTGSRYALNGATAITCTTATITSQGCISTASFGTFSNKVGTSSSATAGQLAYFTTTSGTPALISGVATTSATCGTGLSCTGFSVLGSSPITLTATGASSTLLADTNSWSGSNTYGATTTFSLAAQIGSTAGDHQLTITPSRTYGASVSAGGALLLTNTSNDGAGAVFFTNHTSGATGRLVVVNCNQSTFDQNCLHIQSNSDTASALNLSAAPSGLGAFKWSASAAGNSNSSGISLDASTNSFAGQALFGKCGNASGSTSPCYTFTDAYSGTIFRMTNGGNFGIGTTSPGTLLSIASNVNIGNGTTTQQNGGIDIAAGCFSVRGTCLTSGGGSGTPGGSNTQVQFNDSGSFGGDAGFTYDKVADRVTVPYASTTAVTVSSELTIPNSSSQAPTTIGDIGVDTTNFQIKVGSGITSTVFDYRRFYSFGYATSTWAGTTTATQAPFPVAGELNRISCTTNQGSVTVRLQYGPTPTSVWVIGASTTPGIISFSSGSFVVGALASSTASFGNPSGSPTSVACTATFSISGT